MPRRGIKRGDIVLIPFPFTNLAAEKLRPAVIISGDPQEVDVVVAFISSMVHEDLANTDFLFSSSHPDFPISGLKKTSVFKLKKTLDRREKQAHPASRTGNSSHPV